MKLYGFGTAPDARAAGYGRFLKEIRGTEAHLTRALSDVDVAVVDGGELSVSPNHLYGVFERDAPEVNNEYDVHIFAIVRVKFRGIKAASMEKAIRIAEREDLHALIDRQHAVDQADKGLCAHVEYNDEKHGAFVDVVGDGDYLLSQHFRFEDDAIQKT